MHYFFFQFLCFIIRLKLYVTLFTILYDYGFPKVHVCFHKIEGWIFFKVAFLLKRIINGVSAFSKMINAEAKLQYKNIVLYRHTFSPLFRNNSTNECIYLNNKIGLQVLTFRQIVLYGKFKSGPLKQISKRVF
jgi:hypothetical protein